MSVGAVGADRRSPAVCGRSALVSSAFSLAKEAVLPAGRALELPCRSTRSAHYVGPAADEIRRDPFSETCKVLDLARNRGFKPLAAGGRRGGVVGGGGGGGGGGGRGGGGVWGGGGGGGWGGGGGVGVCFFFSLCFFFVLFFLYFFLRWWFIVRGSPPRAWWPSVPQLPFCSGRPRIALTFQSAMRRAADAPPICGDQLGRTLGGGNAIGLGPSSLEPVPM